MILAWASPFNDWLYLEQFAGDIDVHDHDVHDHDDHELLVITIPDVFDGSFNS